MHARFEYECVCMCGHCTRVKFMLILNRYIFLLLTFARDHAKHLHVCVRNNARVIIENASAFYTHITPYRFKGKKCMLFMFVMNLAFFCFGDNKLLSN